MFERVSNLVRTNAPRPRGLRIMLAAALLTVATYAAAVEMRGDHPDSYVVKRGDTLWDISARFLKKPWLWPEIWQANPQIKNPHLIYPGDIISLAYLDRVTVKQQGERTASPINAVPLSEVAPFLKDLRIVDSIDQLPYVVDLEGNRLRGVQGHVAYVKGLDAAPGQRYLVVRAEKRYRATGNGRHHAMDLDARGGRLLEADPYWSNLAHAAGGELMGYELITQTTGTVTRGVTDGSDVSTVLLDAEGRDVRAGDRLIPVEAQSYDLQFFPHSPKQQAGLDKLSVMSVADGLYSAGTRNVIAISGGAREGIDNGTVFSLWRNGKAVSDKVASGLDHDEDFFPAGKRARLPDEFAGHAMVFRTFDKVSYALVMSSVKPVEVGYAVKDPDATY